MMLRKSDEKDKVLRFMEFITGKLYLYSRYNYINYFIKLLQVIEKKVKCYNRKPPNYPGESGQISETKSVISDLKGGSKISRLK